MTTIFTHPAVERYLAELDNALAHTPTEHADDLRAQVREHLGEALPANATDAQIEETLSRLGPTDRIAAGDDEPRRTVIYARLSFGDWLKQRPRNFWAALAAVAVLLISSTAAVTVESHIAALQGGCEPCGFFFSENRTHAKWTSIGGFDDDSVPERFGQDQAITFTIDNPSRYAQRIRGGQIGLPPDLTAEPMSLDVATISQGRQDLSNDWPSHFVTHDVLIPAHAVQQVVLHWVQNGCHDAGDTETVQGIQLKVTTLGVTRTETVPIDHAFTIVGSGGARRCRMGARAHGLFRIAL